MGDASPPPAGDGWTTVVSKGIFGAYDAGASAFVATLTASPSKIIRRDCASCERDNPAATVFYKRLTPLPACRRCSTSCAFSSSPKGARHTAALPA
jgi:hypothetical protein